VGRSSSKRRKPQHPLPPAPHYVKPPYGTMRHWRLGGPLTDAHEAEALAAERARPPGRIGRLVLRLLGGKGEPEG
jgi:hypothetical protein